MQNSSSCNRKHPQKQGENAFFCFRIRELTSAFYWLTNRLAALFAATPRTNHAQFLYTERVMSCLFCRIVEGSIPSKATYQDEHCYAFADIDPQAPVHILVVPRQHVASLDGCSQKDAALLSHLLLTARQIAEEQHLANGYRLVINTGADGGQTVEHLHVHLLGGRAMAWPPG